MTIAMERDEARQHDASDFMKRSVPPKIKQGVHFATLTFRVGRITLNNTMKESAKAG
jgi:hypothetical protein